MTTALHRLRLMRGQSLRQLAADVGCSYETVRRLEHGVSTDARPSTRVAFERVLGVPFSLLIVPLNDDGGAHMDAAASPTTAKKSEAVHGV